MPENVSAVNLGLALGALMAVSGLFAVYYRHLVRHNHSTARKVAWCLFCIAAALILRRGHGRHRMRDKYHLQRWIRADWRELTPRSLTGWWPGRFRRPAGYGGPDSVRSVRCAAALP